MRRKKRILLTYASISMLVANHTMAKLPWANRMPPLANLEIWHTSYSSRGLNLSATDNGLIQGVGTDPYFGTKAFAQNVSSVLEISWTKQSQIAYYNKSPWLATCLGTGLT